MNRLRLHVLAAAVLSFATVACGPLESADDGASTAAPGEAPVAKDIAGASGAHGLVLSAATPTGGSTLQVTVTATRGARVYLTYSKALFAGPGWVKLPADGTSATVTLQVSPFVTAPTGSTVSARTSTPDPGSFFSQPVTVLPPASPPATRPQVASAILAPASVVSGGTATLELTLTSPAPAAGAAVLVAITNDFLGLDADVAPVVVVPPGATRAIATIRTHLSSAVTTSVTENVIANLFGGTFRGGPLEVTAR
jgi:hypothetical protein